MESAFTHGINKNIVATDTCKNTVYCIANQHEFTSIEEFGLLLARHFLTEHKDKVNKVNIIITKDNWVRIKVSKGKGKELEDHNHAFQRVGPFKQFTHVTGEKRPSTNFKFNITSGFKSLEILKTTQSGFSDFDVSRFRSLPDVADRLLGTSADIDWVYNENDIKNNRINYVKAFEEIKQALLDSFAGPAKIGVFSPSVQETLYKMGVAALKTSPHISSIALYMPNIHNIPFNLETYGLKNGDHTGSPTIFFPIDEPHGMIRAVINRNNLSKL